MVIEYHERFESLAVKVLRKIEEWLTSVYMAELWGEIQAKIRMFGEMTLDTVMCLSLCIEARNWVLTRLGP